jgi:zinc-finger protein CreA/MIG
MQSQQQRPASFHEREVDHGAPDMNMLRPMGGVQDMHHQETKDLPRPYKCPMCEKAFHRLEHQTRHIRTHTGEKPHACTFQGCTKKFSRSDELTRHSRIHMNPNGRRGHKSASSLHRTNMVDNHHSSNLMPPPNAKIIPKSAPTSTIGSPNVSPPNSYLAPLGGYRSHPGSSYDFSILARTATQQLERERNPTYGSSNSLNAYSYQQKRAAPYPSGLSSQPMSRSHSYERDSEDPYSAHRAVKRSRPGTPVSTAPSSPTFSHDSCSPTPEHTPLATPHHSPRLYPRDYPMSNSDYQLPSIRNLTLAPPSVRISPHQEPNHGARLPPMEIADPFFGSSGNTSTPPNGPSGLSHIFARPDPFGRKLPPPVPNVRPGPLVIGSSASNSAANSIAGGDLSDRL